MTLTKKTTIIAMAAIGLSIGLLSGCSTAIAHLPALLAQNTSTHPLSSPDPASAATGSGPASVQALVTGNCFNGGSGSEVDNVPTVPCASPHDQEVFATLVVAGDIYPGDEALKSQADSGCSTAFTSFVGLPFEQSALQVTYYRPSTTTWAGGDRTIDCLIAAESGQASGTLRGANR